MERAKYSFVFAQSGTFQQAVVMIDLAILVYSDEIQFAIFSKTMQVNLMTDMSLNPQISLLEKQTLTTLNVFCRRIRKTLEAEK